MDGDNNRVIPPGLMVPMEWCEMFSALDDSAVADLIRGALAYVATGQNPEIKKQNFPIFCLMKPRIDYQIEQYRKTVSGSRKAATERWKMRTHANACERMRTDANACERMRSDTTITLKQTKLKDTVKKKNTKKEKSEKLRIVLKYTLGRLYHRRRSTVWSAREDKALSEVIARPDAWEEAKEIYRAYSGGYVYRRHDIQTLLNNWPTEFDRAQNYNREKKEKSNGPDDLSRRYQLQ